MTASLSLLSPRIMLASYVNGTPTLGPLGVSLNFYSTMGPVRRLLTWMDTARDVFANEELIIGRDRRTW